MYLKHKIVNVPKATMIPTLRFMEIEWISSLHFCTKKSFIESQMCIAIIANVIAEQMYSYRLYFIHIKTHIEYLCVYINL